MPGDLQKPAAYIEVGLSVPDEIHDAVGSFITDNFAPGLVLEGPDDASMVGIKFYIAEDKARLCCERLALYISAVRPGGNSSPGQISTRRVENTEWTEAYRQSVKPITVGRVIIRPPWLEVNAESTLELIMEPRMAFGTGRHETTRLCMMQIEKYLRPGQIFFDLGCGSGILLILAAKLGARKVVGVDIDPFAVANARENAGLNKVAGKVTIRSGSIDKAADLGPFDLIVANLLKSTIVQLLDNMLAMLSDDGLLVLSGLLTEERESVEKTVRSRGRQKLEVNQDGGWLAITVFG